MAVSCDDPEIVANEIARGMQFELEARSSHYWGPYWTELPDRSLRIFWNRDPLFDSTTDPPEDKWFQSQFPDHAVLIDVDQNEGLCAQVTELVLTAFPGSLIVSE